MGFSIMCLGAKFGFVPNFGILTKFLLEAYVYKIFSFRQAV